MHRLSVTQKRTCGDHLKRAFGAYLVYCQTCDTRDYQRAADALFRSRFIGNVLHGMFGDSFSEADREDVASQVMVIVLKFLKHRQMRNPVLGAFITYLQTTVRQAAWTWRRQDVAWRRGGREIDDLIMAQAVSTGLRPVPYSNPEVMIFLQEVPREVERRAVVLTGFVRGTEEYQRCAQVIACLAAGLARSDTMVACAADAALVDYCMVVYRRAKDQVWSAEQGDADDTRAGATGPAAAAAAAADG